MGLTDLEKIREKQRPQGLADRACGTISRTFALPVDNFVDNANESLLFLPIKIPKRPESAEIREIKIFKNNDLKNNARGGSNPVFFLPSVHKCRTGTFFRQSCCALQNRRRIDRAGAGSNGAKRAPERDSYPQPLLITLWTIASPWCAGIP
jgi:hypothetical protein